MRTFKDIFKILKIQVKKIELNLAYIALYDILFLVISALITRSWYLIFQNKLSALAELKLPDLNSIESLALDPLLMEETIKVMQTSLTFFYFSIIALLIIVLLVWSFFHGLIWARVSNVKFNFNFYYKFSILNLIAIVIWAIPIILSFLIFREDLLPYIFLFLIIALVYFTSISYSLFLKNQKIQTIFEGFSLGIKKIGFFSVAFITAGILFLILLIITSIFSFLPQIVSTIFSSLIILIFMGMVRYFVFDIVHHANKSISK